MKKLLLLLTLAFTLTANAQDEKTVTLVVSGQGKTSDEAKQNALRSAIEQAFGAFISSKTEILNDNLVKDEIVSISNGNIQKFDVLSEVQKPDGGYATTLKAIVSVTKLTSFCESKGVAVEFKGSLFAFNISQQQLNETNELKAIENMFLIFKSISSKSFSYSIKASDPMQNSDNKEQWLIPIEIEVKLNNNFQNIPPLIYNTLSGLSMDQNEIASYKKLNKEIYYETYAQSEKIFNRFYLRNEKSVSQLIECIFSFKKDIMNFMLDDGIKKNSIANKKYKSEHYDANDPFLDDTEFDIILTNQSGNVRATRMFFLWYGQLYRLDDPPYEHAGSMSNYYYLTSEVCNHGDGRYGNFANQAIDKIERELEKVSNKVGICK